MASFGTVVRHLCLGALALGAAGVAVAAASAIPGADSLHAGVAGRATRLATGSPLDPGLPALDAPPEIEAAPACGVRLVTGAVVPHALMPKDLSRILSVCLEVSFDVRPDGGLENVRIHADVPEALRARALAVLGKARFTPALTSGEPVERRDVRIALVLPPEL